MGKYRHTVLRSIDYRRYKGSHLAWQKHKRKWGRKPSLKKYAKQHRANPTRAEELFKKYLRQVGIQFSMQRVIGRFIVDFFFIKRNLIVEIDGAYHQKTAEYDETRQRYLRDLGFIVLRFTNQQIYKRPKFCIEQVLHEPEDPDRVAINKKIITNSKKEWLYNRSAKQGSAIG